MRPSLRLPHSIRWRLPTSYAAIALIAALALGAVLLTTLRGYYAQVEWDYLNSNALAVRAIINDMETHDAPAETIQTQLQNMSFLAQVRIQRLDQNQNLVSDTGLPENNFLSIARDPNLRIVQGEPPGDPVAAPPAGTTYAGADSAVAASSSDNLTAVGPTWMPDRVFSFRYLRDAVRESEASAQGTPGAGEPPLPSFFAFPARRTLFGFNLYAENADRTLERSSQSVQVALVGDDTGYVKLSEGPAYGLEIVDGVARAWLVASAIAVGFAALVGFVVSQRISAPLVALTQVTAQMSDGDLSARSSVEGEDEVGVLAKSFNEMANRVEETITTLRRFVADAAHELHTPLTALRTNLELLGDDDPDGQHHRFVAHALNQVNRLETLTSDLLELSRLEAGSERAYSAPVNLSALIRDTSEFYASQAEQANIEFDIDVPAGEIVIAANESLIRRALGNLLENAIKFTPSGGTILVALQAAPDGVAEVRVQDTGIGIPDGDLPQLFNRFHRGRNASAYPGSGLGLAIVKAIMDAHNGSVSAKQMHPGTQFTVRLQASSAP